MTDHVAFVDNDIAAANRVTAAWLNPVNQLVYKGRNPNFATTTGSANAQVLTLATGSLYTSEADGDTFGFIAGATNTGAMTLQVIAPAGSLTARAVQLAGQALVEGEVTSGRTYLVTRVGTTWQLMNITATTYIQTLLNDVDAATAAETLAVIAKAIGTTKGDLIGFSANATPVRQGVGADGTVLTADSTATAGVAWSAAGFTTGDVKLTLKTVADTGWVLMDDGTIGNAASGGTTRANADTEDLFTLLWTNTADAQCPVSTGRGASAAADYAANKTITLPLALGRALATYGTGASLTARVLAETLGVETHTLTAAELPTTVIGGTGLGPQYTSAAGGSFPGQQNTTLGGGGAHENMQPTLFLNVMIKL